MGCNSSREGPGDVPLAERHSEELAQAQQQVEKLRGELEAAEQRVRVMGQEAAEGRTASEELVQLRQRLQKAEADLATAQGSLEETTRALVEERRVAEELRAKVSKVKRKSKKSTAAVVVAVEEPAAKEAAPKQTTPRALQQSGAVKSLQQQAASSGDDNVDRLKKELEQEKKLTAELRAEVMRKTKEALSAAAQGGGNGLVKGTTGAVTVVSSTEQQRMNEALLRSEVNLARETAAEERALRRTADGELERAAEQRSALLAQLSAKDKTIADLTVRLHAAQGDASHLEGMAGLDSKLSELDSRHDKLDTDIEMMAENLRLAGVVAEREEEIAALKAQLAAK